MIGWGVFEGWVVQYFGTDTAALVYQSYVADPGAMIMGWFKWDEMAA